MWLCRWPVSTWVAIITSKSGNCLTHRKVNDQICLAHGLRVLEECDPRKKKKRMKPGEYQAGLRGDSREGLDEVVELRPSCFAEALLGHLHLNERGLWDAVAASDQPRA